MNLHLYKIKRIAGITVMTCGNFVIINKTVIDKIITIINFMFFLNRSFESCMNSVNKTSKIVANIIPKII